MTMTMRQRQPSDLPAWLQRLVFGNLPKDEPPPPESSAIEALRLEFRSAIEAERQASQAALQDERSARRALANDLKATREELAEARGYTEMLQRVTANQDRLLQEQGSLVTTLQEQQRQALDDKQHQARMITALRDQMSAQQAEIAELRERLRLNTEEMAATRNQALVSDAKARILEDENTRLRAQIVALGGTP